MYGIIPKLATNASHLFIVHSIARLSVRFPPTLSPLAKIGKTVSRSSEAPTTLKDLLTMAESRPVIAVSFPVSRGRESLCGKVNNYSKNKSLSFLVVEG